MRSGELCEIQALGEHDFGVALGSSRRWPVDNVSMAVMEGLGDDPEAFRRSTQVSWRLGEFGR